MGNKFGNYASLEIAQSAILAEGFKPNGHAMFTKRSVTGGNLISPPRECVAIVEITSYWVDGKWADDGKDCHVYQHHFIQ